MNQALPPGIVLPRARRLLLALLLLVSLSLASVTALAAPGGLPGGPVILDGNDPADHVSQTGPYIRDVYTTLEANVAAGYAHNGQVAVIGTCASMLGGMGTGQSFVQFGTGTAVSGLLDDIGSNNYKHLHICSDDDRTLPADAEAALDARGAAIAEHVNRGGGLFATGHSYNWLGDLFPSLVVTYGGTSASYVTADGDAFFPTLNENDYLGAINHYTFSNVASTTLLPLLSESTNGGGRIVAIGGVTVRFPQISLTGPTEGVVGTDETYTLTAADSDGNVLSNNSFTYTITGPTGAATSTGTGTTDAAGQYQFTFTASSPGATRLAVQMTLGSGAAAGSSITTDWATLPAAPGSVSATDVPDEDGSVEVTWNAPNDGGAALTDYVVEYSTGSGWTTVADGVSTSRSVTITGLTNATDYDIRVAAVNRVGQGPWSTVATATPAGPPSLPTLLSLTPGDGTIAATWQAPTNDNGSAVTHYVLQHSPAGTDTWSSVAPDPTGLSATISGLTNGQAYDVRVAAVNADSQSAWSNELTATPVTVPDAVSNLGVAESDGTLVVTWSVPAFDGGTPVTGYDVSTDFGQSCTPVHFHPASAGPHEHWYRCTYTGLTNGDDHTVIVNARNAVGAGPGSAVVGSPFGPAAAPVASVTDGDTTSTVTWTVPDGNGRPITGYEVRVDGVLTATLGSGTLTHDLTGLTNGDSYDVTVAAITEAGPGALGSTTARPFGLPAAPTPTVTEGDGTLAITWPAVDGNGRDVTGYEVRVDGLLVETLAGDELTTTLTGLTNGTSYAITVTALNPAGAGDAGAASGVPFGPALAPPVTVTEGDGQLVVDWDAADGNGRPVTAYEVRLDGVLVATTAPDARTTTLTGLTNGQHHDVTVAAVTASGTGAAGEADGTPYGLPSAPSVTVTPGDRQLTVTWTPGSTGGRDITGYTIKVGGFVFATVPGSTRSIVVPDLAPGTSVPVSVVATNLRGDGPAGLASGTPITTPGAVRDLVVTPGPGTLAVSWTPPASDGGSPIASYLVRVRPVGSTEWIVLETSETSALLTGLDPAVSYEVEVLATNLAGGSVAADDATVAQPAALPQTGASLELLGMLAAALLLVGAVLRRPRRDTAA